MSAPYGERFAATGQAGSPASITSSTSKPAARQPGLVAGIQDRQAEYERLLGLCQQLQRQHRCPGRCVLTGEPRSSGLAGLRSMLDGRV